jgi:hypothetical protein
MDSPGHLSDNGSAGGGGEKRSSGTSASGLPLRDLGRSALSALLCSLHVVGPAAAFRARETLSPVWLRASGINRSWSARRSALPAVATPAFPDEAPHDDHHLRESHPKVDHPPLALGAPHQLLVGVVPGTAPLAPSTCARLAHSRTPIAWQRSLMAASNTSRADSAYSEASRSRRGSAWYSVRLTIQAGNPSLTPDRRFKPNLWRPVFKNRAEAQPAFRSNRD